MICLVRNESIALQLADIATGASATVTLLLHLLALIGGCHEFIVSLLLVVPEALFCCTTLLTALHNLNQKTKHKSVNQSDVGRVSEEASE